MSNGVNFKKMAIESRDLLNAALARDAALREELYTVRDLHAKQCCVFCNDTGNLRAVHDAIQQRLTVAEQRAGELESLVRDVEPMVAKKHSSPWFAKRYAALKPAEEGEWS